MRQVVMVVSVRIDREGLGKMDFICSLERGV